MTNVRSEAGDAGPTAPLADALRALATARAAGDALRQNRAASTLQRLARPRLLALLRRHLHGDDPRVEDVSQEVFLTVIRSSHDFGGQTDGEAFSWLRTIAFSRATEAHRHGAARGGVHESYEEKQRKSDRPLQDEALERRGQTEVMAELLRRSESVVLSVVVARAPEDLYAAAREATIGASSPAVRRNLLVWRQVRLRQRDALDLARELDALPANANERTKKAARAKIAKQAQRGAAAIALGATWLLREARDPERRAQLECLRDWVAQRQKAQRQKAQPQKATKNARKGGSSDA